MKIKELREIASKRNEGYWHETPGMSTNWHEYTEEFEEAMESHIDALLDVAEAAKAYEHAQWQFGLAGSTRTGRALDTAYKSLMEAFKKLEEI